MRPRPLGIRAMRGEIGWKTAFSSTSIPSSPANVGAVWPHAARYASCRSSRFSRAEGEIAPALALIIRTIWSPCPATAARVLAYQSGHPAPPLVLLRFGELTAP